ncbi:18562_t:CDS:2 [Gigaspora rosea]|nr:18562_t:CDS:2 [Gigaspora rosea]
MLISCVNQNARIKGSTNRKCPYTELRTDSQKNNRIVLIAKDLKIQTTKLFYNHQFANLSDANIVKFELAKLKIADQDITLDYQHKNENKQQYYSFLVWICDKTLISHNEYRKLAAVDSNMSEENITENVTEIDVDLNNSKIENAVYRLIKSLLTVWVPALTTSNLVVLCFGDKINIKIGGDA